MFSRATDVYKKQNLTLNSVIDEKHFWLNPIIFHLSVDSTIEPR